MVREAHPVFEETAQEELALKHFLCALLPEELRWHMQLATMAAATKAEREELILSKKTTRRVTQCCMVEELRELMQTGPRANGGEATSVLAMQEDGKLHQSIL